MTAIVMALCPVTAAMRQLACTLVFTKHNLPPEALCRTAPRRQYRFAGSLRGDETGDNDRADARYLA